MPHPATIDINIDPVLHLGGLGIHWYGIMYAVAFGVGLYYGVIPHFQKRGIDRATSERYTTWAIVFGLLGARLYYVLQSSPPQGGSWFSHPGEILAVWHGGMAFFGALVAAPATVVFLAWREKHNWWLVADGAAVFAVLGQPIGRIGNVINGDILGYQSSLPWATSYSNPNAILQAGFVNCAPFKAVGQPCIAYQPAAVYEALGTLCILAVLFTVRARFNPRAGTLWIAYVGLYSLSQLLIFFTRGSEPVVALGLKQGQWTALVVGLIGVPALYWVWRRGLLNWAPAGTETGALVDAAVEAPGEPGEEVAAEAASEKEDAVPAGAAQRVTGSAAVAARDEVAPPGKSTADVEKDVLPGAGADEAAAARRERRRQERAERKSRKAAAVAAAGGGDGGTSAADSEEDDGAEPAEKEPGAEDRGGRGRGR
jgi:phosphatidylglycerol:prolipoprotein diacylglycerol transferase